MGRAGGVMWRITVRDKLGRVRQMERAARGETGRRDGERKEVSWDGAMRLPVREQRSLRGSGEGRRGEVF